MATQTLGSNANNSLPFALTFKHGYNSGMSAADIATIAQNIKNDVTGLHPVVPESFSSNGWLFVPRRGILKMLAGDVVGVDTSGWPILLSANAIATAPWTLT